MVTKNGIVNKSKVNKACLQTQCNILINVHETKLTVHLMLDSPYELFHALKQAMSRSNYIFPLNGRDSLLTGNCPISVYFTPSQTDGCRLKITFSAVNYEAHGDEQGSKTSYKYMTDTEIPQLLQPIGKS